MNNHPLKESVALVTGAGRGIGQAIARTLARAGADIVVNDLDPESAGDTAEMVEAAGSKAMVHTADISDAAQVEEMFARIQARFKGPDILINNAGITRDGFIEDLEEADWDAVMSTNLKSIFHCIRRCIPLMKAGGGGKIVNLTSVSAQVGNPGQANYTASKAGVVGLTRTLSRELARYNIRVNAVAPGFIDTPMTQAVPEKVRQKILSAIPLGRPGTSEDVARAVRFLATKDSDYITGQILSCNGGMYLG